MNLWLVLGLYSLFMAFYWFFAWSIYWHVKEYTMPHDGSVTFVHIFFVVALVLSALSLALLFTLPLTY